MENLNNITNYIRTQDARTLCNPTLEIVSENPRIGILHYDIKDTKERICFIYLLDEDKITSPGFVSLRPLKDEDSLPFFEFKDKIYSTVTVESETTTPAPLTTTITGFIRPNGIMHESIYDDYFNIERSSAFNKTENFEDYLSLKEFISHKLDKKAQEENERIASIKRNKESFHTKAKTLNYGKKN